MAAGLSSGRPDALLLYLASGSDLQRFAVGPALAAAAERAGWGFECYYDALARGRHYGGGDPEAAAPGVAHGSPFAGGRHAERAARLCTLYATAALGDSGSPLWAPLEQAGAEELVRGGSPAELYAAAFERLGAPLPELALVLDGTPQGPFGIATAPFLYPALLAGEPALAVDVSASAEEREALERLGVRRFRGLGVAPDRAAGFPGGLSDDEPLDVSAGWAQFTAAAARRHRAWGRGVMLAGPEVVSAQLPKARRLRLLPLHGRPQTEAIEAAADIVEAAAEPVYGRQWDDHDFFELARAGHGLQVIDPGPPFDAAGAAGPALPEPVAEGEPEPDDAQLLRWADEGRVLVTLLLWSGMLRELDCIPRLIDLAVLTDLRAGLVVTAESFEHGAGEALDLLAVPPARGGVLGRLEPVLGSTGRGVAAEAYIGGDRLAAHLAESLAAIEARAPAALRPRGWWPLLDAPLVEHRELPAGVSGGRPQVRFRSRGPAKAPGPAAPAQAHAPRRDLRALAGRSVRATGLDRFLEEARPYDGTRPGQPDEGVVAAVRGAGFEYMWSKAGFGEPRVLRRDGDFVVLPFTAGAWDGWSPFYTVGDAGALARAERRLLRRGQPGWLATTIDSPLFALPGEVWENGARLHGVARAVAAGGRSGELVNVTPSVLARYARLLDDRAAAARGA